MDLSVLILGGLAGIGYYLNRQGRNIRKQKPLRSDVYDHEHPNTYHVYEDNRIPYVMKQEESILKDLYKKSESPAETRVIPPFYNTFGNKKKALEQSQTIMGRIPQLLTKEELKETKVRTQISDTNPVRSAYKNQPQELGNFPVENFMNVGYHTNMVPHTKRRDIEQFGDISNALFETTAGYGDNIITHKQDTPSFHKITVNNNVHGTPFYGDSLQQRAAQGASFKKQNERPFQPLQTAPSTSEAGRGGLGGDEGYQSMYRPTAEYLSVDNLRAKNNPKITYDANGLEGSAKSFVSQGPIVMEERMYHPEREQTLNFNHVTAGSSESLGSKLRPDLYPQIHNNQRTTTQKEYFGSASADETANRLVPEKFMLGGRFEEITKGYRGPASAEEKHTYSRDKDYRLYPTIKEQTSDSYSGNVNSDIKDTKVYNMTPERNTHRVSTDSSYYNTAGKGESGSFVCRDNQYNAEINALKEATSTSWKPSQEYNKVEASRDGVKRDLMSRTGMITRTDPTIMNAMHINVQNQSTNDTQIRYIPRQAKSSLRGSVKTQKQQDVNVGQLSQLDDNPYQTTPFYKM